MELFGHLKSEYGEDYEYKRLVSVFTNDKN